ncbi:hypothetical protein [Novacetimonas pomaceti]|nr:hypothetical protein [Novacetimonas pomaceti]
MTVPVGRPVLKRAGDFPDRCLSAAAGIVRGGKSRQWNMPGSGT